MTQSSATILAFGLAAVYALTGCGEKAHDHDGHAHHDHKEAKHDEHEHDEIVAGPNGGRVLTDVEPHAEFFVTEDRKVQIAFLDDDLQPVAAGAQEVRIVAGDRSNPTKLAFAKSGDVMLSDDALPDGNDFPVVVQIKASADAKAVPVKFNLNMAQCPTCENKEYACTCEHEH